MRVLRFSIRNILGVEHLEVNEMGSLTMIGGENGSGKTSCLEAIRAALGTGTDATLLRKGAKEGEVVLVLDDGTEIRSRVTEGKSDHSVSLPDIGKISKPATYLKKLSDALSLNPIDLIAAPGKSAADQKRYRLEALLAAIPMQVTFEQLGFVPAAAMSGVNLEEHALTTIGKIQKSIYDLRTGVNRSERDKLGMVRQMEETLPATAPDGDWQTSHDQTLESMQRLQTETKEQVDHAKQSASTEIESLREVHAVHKTTVLKEIEDAIQKLRADAAIEIQRSEAARDESIRSAEASRDGRLSDLEAEYRPQYKTLADALAQAKAMIEQSARDEKTREVIAQVTKEANDLNAESSKLTHSMGRLEILKASLLEKLPIPGLSVQDGDIYFGEIPWDRVNEAKKIQLAIEIAKLRSGSLGLVAIDGLERLDRKTFETFKKEAAKSNLQFVVSRVSEGPLTIETEGAA